ncbi:hypothetical protein AY586_14615 [Marichromatium gracile]|uniref:Uncharacterized protein n=1 Tax=Marichromatium gracile TaxID=1048 RepID=A0ABR5VER6_MARGR|nr:hypothetical protein AY586_14615 [Marichromatium gracile]
MLSRRRRLAAERFQRRGGVCVGLTGGVTNAIERGLDAIERGLGLAAVGVDAEFELEIICHAGSIAARRAPVSESGLAGGLRGARAAPRRGYIRP